MTTARDTIKRTPATIGNDWPCGRKVQVESHRSQPETEFC